jgi:hypothetical protein
VGIVAGDEFSNAEFALFWMGNALPVYFIMRSKCYWLFSLRNESRST